MTGGGSAIFAAIADDTRRSLLTRLASEAEAPVNSLAADFKVSRGRISQHLRILRDAGLVRDRKVGRQRLYSLSAEPLGAIRDWVADLDRFWARRMRALGDYLEEANNEGDRS